MQDDLSVSLRSPKAGSPAGKLSTDVLHAESALVQLGEATGHRSCSIAEDNGLGWTSRLEMPTSSMVGGERANFVKERWFNRQVSYATPLG
jgi:hypothetical protein